MSQRRGEDRLEVLFHRALELAPDERRAWLAGLADDPELVDELRSLLAAHAEAPDCLEHPAWAPGDRALADDPPVVGRGTRVSRLGPYVLKRLLGEGGMGSVYLADQEGPLRRPVALKLIKLGMDTAEVVARFDAERQALAVLNHPNIAAVHDAGVSPRGRPYFVMEYVPGQRITEFCDQRKLPVRERLRAFLAVCDAVQHAHQKGVIHRDLKPSNILVKQEDGRVVPKIIDFGVAKATGASGGLRTVTRRGQLIGTPGYMSPEQAGAVSADVDTRTDVYSLGVLLYELLAGCLPYEARILRRAGDGELRRLLAEVEAVRPSVRLGRGVARTRRVAARRGTEPRALVRALRGDLDWIVMRALARHPEDRYATAAALAADILAYLNHEPVTAGPPGLGYRVGKLAARHRVPVVGSALVMVAALTGLAGFAWQQSSRSHELSAENALMRQSHDAVVADAHGLADDVVAMVQACDAAREVAGERAPPYATAFVLNGASRPLAPGEVVEIVGVARPDGELPAAAPAGSVIEVVPARAGSGRALLGTVDGAWRHEAEGHGHRVRQAIEPGAVGLAATSGPLASVVVDTSQGAIRAHDPLGLGARAGRAARRLGAGPQLGVALEGWSGEGEGLILALVAPEHLASFEPSVERPVASSRWLGRQRPGEGSAPIVPQGHTVSTGSRAPVLPGSGPAPTTLLAALGSSASLPSAAGAMAAGSTGGSAAPDTLAAIDDDEEALPAPPAPPSGSGSAIEEGGNDGQIGAIGKSDPGAGPGGQGDGADGDPNHHGLGKLAGGPLETADDGRSVGGQVGTMEVQQAWGDVDGDGRSDVLVGDGDGLTLLRNLGGGRFDDITPWSGLEATSSVAEAAFADVDQDGRDDLLVLDAQGQLQLHRALGAGAFEPATAASGLDRLPPVASWSSFHSDDDGAVDLRLVTRRGELVLLVNDGAGRFTPAVLREGAQQDEPAGSDGGPSVAGPANAPVGQRP